MAQPLVVCKFRPQPEEAFRPVAESFRVHVVDLPGHGESAMSEP